MASDDTKKSLSEAITDHFWLQTVFPEAGKSFLFQQKNLETIKGTCSIFLDANVLLLPYKLESQSLLEILKVYKYLADAKRLYVPAQAAREYLKNRGEKLRDIVREISNQISRIQLPFDKGFGFLALDTTFSEIKEITNQISQLKKQVMKKADLIRESLINDIGRDPVSISYQEIMSQSIVDHDEDIADQENLLKELRWRYHHDIPPGYKDKSKIDGGIGDFLIWKAILRVATETKRDCIFVTEDTKGDWWVQSEGAFQPRFELIDEYRRASDGATIHLMPLSDMLLLFGAEPNAVEDARRAEVVARRDRQISLPIVASTEKIADSLQAGTGEFSSYGLVDLNRLSSEMQEEFRSLVPRHIELEALLANEGKTMTEDELRSTLREKESVWNKMNSITKARSAIQRRITDLI